LAALEVFWISAGKTVIEETDINF